jgi:hypothetical protein
MHVDDHTLPSVGQVMEGERTRIQGRAVGQGKSMSEHRHRHSFRRKRRGHKQERGSPSTGGGNGRWRKSRGCADQIRSESASGEQTANER